MKKRLLSILLTACMVLTLLPSLSHPAKAVTYAMPPKYALEPSYSAHFKESGDELKQDGSDERAFVSYYIYKSNLFPSEQALWEAGKVTTMWHTEIWTGSVSWSWYTTYLLCGAGIYFSNVTPTATVTINNPSYGINNIAFKFYENKGTFQYHEITAPVTYNASFVCAEIMQPPNNDANWGNRDYGWRNQNAIWKYKNLGTNTSLKISFGNDSVYPLAKPAASEIISGQTLSASTLSGGKATAYGAYANLGESATDMQNAYSKYKWYDSNTQMLSSGAARINFETIYSNYSTTEYFENTVQTVNVPVRAAAITLDKAGGSGGSASAQGWYGSSLSDITIPTLSNYKFTGYYSASSGGTQYYDASGKAVRNWDVAADTTLYAQWEVADSTATVTINKDGSPWSGSGKSLALYQSGMKKYDLTLSGSSATCSALAGEYDVYDGSTDTGVNISVSSGGDNAATVNYYTLSLSPGTGTSAPTGSGIYLPGQGVSINATVNTGYVWNKWTSNNTGLLSDQSTKSTNITMPAGAVTLTATTTSAAYTISYQLNGGTVDTANPTSYQYTDSDFKLINPTRTGYTFVGWTGSNGETAQTDVTLASGSTGNKSYTANWKADKPTSAPTASIVTAKTDTSLTITTEAGYEYSVNGTDWYSGTGSYTFTDLSPNTPYNLVYRKAAVTTGDTFSASDASAPLPVNTKIASASVSAPTAPIIGTGSDKPTSNSITFSTAAGNEYYISTSATAPTTWPTSGSDYFKATSTDVHTFTSLTAGTKYYIYVRAAETDDAMPSVSAYVAQYTLPATPATSVVTVNYAAEMISFDNTYEVSTSADFTTTISSGSTLTPGTTYYVRVKSANGVPTSEAVGFAVEARPTAPDAVAAENISKTDTAITIASTVSTQEYSVDGGTNWQTGTGGNLGFSPLSASHAYSVVTRSKATATSFSSVNSTPLSVTTKTAPASAPAEPTIGTDANKPTSTSVTISTAAGNEYYISTSATAPTTWPVNGSDYFKATSTDVHTFTSLTAGTKYYIYVRAAETDDAMPSASAYVTQYTLPATPTASAVTINYAEETISFVNTYEVSASADFTTTISSGSTLTPGATYYVRKAANGEVPASSYVSLTVTARPAEPTSSAYSYDYENEKLLFGSQYEVFTATSGGSAVTSDSTAITPGGTLYIRLKATSSAPVSGWTTITIPARPATLGLSIMAVRTDTTITVAAISGAEYSKDGGTTWQSSNVFAGLYENTDYNINIRYAATDYSFASSPLSYETLKTKTAPGTAPNVPSLSTQTYDTITIDTISGYQYAVTADSTAPTTWDAAEMINGTKTFSGLSAATEYYVWVRVAETDTAMPSDHISKGVYTAAAAPAVNTVATDFSAETITFDSATYEVNTKSDFTGTSILSGSSINAYIADSGTESQNLFVRVKAVASGAPASLGTAVSIPARPAAPSAVGSNETVSNKSDGKITGLTTAMEWKLSGGTYAAVTADQALNGITGLPDATYFVRYVAVTSGSAAFSSAEQEISIDAGYTITVTFDSKGGSAVSQIATKSYGDKITDTVTAPTLSGYNFAGWYKDTACSEVWSFAIDTLTDNITLYAKWSAVPTYTVTGIVVDNASPAAAVVKDANVKVMQGTTQFGTTGLTDAYGDFSINNVPAGNYNLVITKGTKTAIIKISVSSGNVAVGNVILPSGNANSILVINGSDTPDVVVGGLNTEASTQLVGNESVVITMTVEKKDASTAANGTEVSASVEGTGQQVGMILDINLIRSVNGGSPATLSETSNLIETIIPIPGELRNKATYKVYRYHETAIDTITEIENTYKEKIVIDRTNWILTLYTKKFSTYAIGYTNPSSSGAKYTITASAGEGGSISPNSANVSASLNQTFTITANDGYSISDVLVDGVSVGAVSSYTFTNIISEHTIKAVFKQTETAGLPYYAKDGKTIFIGFSSDESGKMKYIAPSGVTVLFKENQKNFTDTSGHWAMSYINFVTKRELFLGTGGIEFSPESGMTRAMFATVIGRLYERSYDMNQTENSRNFSDVDYDAYYGVYVDWAAENNIITGVGGGKFEPDREITREEMAAILYRFVKFLNAIPDGSSNAVLGYPDSADIALWAKEAAAFCQQTGIITGRDGGNFVPKGTVTRAEVAAILKRFIVEIVK